MATEARSAVPVGSLEEANSLIYQIKDCKSQVEVVVIVHRLVAFFGAEWFVFVSLRRDDSNFENYRYLIGCMPEWCQIYHDRNWYSNDPFVQHARESSQPIVGSAMKPQSSGQREILETAARYGFRSGMVIPAHAGYKARMGVLYIGSSQEAKEVEPKLLSHQNLLRALSLELYEWWQARIQSEAITAVGLDETDVELLRLQHDGLVARQIAEKLDKQLWDINARFQTINEKLQVKTKVRAVQKAMELGILQG